MLRTILAIAATTALLAPQLASAQVETNDHRDKKSEKVKAKRAKPAPVKVDDHRKDRATPPAGKDRAEQMRDHRDRMRERRERMKGQPGMAPQVNDHRRPSTRVPAKRAVRRWHRDIPSVASYWPAKGKIGRKIMIRGSGFAEGTVVLWGDAELKPVKVSDRRIVVEVPAAAASGFLSVRSPGFARPIPVGQFEVAADYDAEAELERIEKERRKAAEKAWAERQKELAKQSKKERWEALKRRQEELRESREKRRQERVAAIRAKWARDQFLADPQTRAELSLYAERRARLERMKRLAEADARGVLVVRINVLIDREDQRHARRMASLEAAFQAE